MSLRVRLAAALTVVAIVLVGSGVAILGLVRASLFDEIDHQLAGAARFAGTPVADQVRDSGRPPPLDPTGTGSPFTKLYVAELGEDGSMKVVLHSDSPQVPLADGTEVAARASDAAHVIPFDVASADGSVSFRAVAVRASDGTTAMIALPADSAEATYSRVRVGVVAVGVLVFLTLALVGWWVERLGIRPIKSVTDAAAAIAAGDLDRRVETRPRRTEAGQLAEAFNVMIDRRQESDDQLRRFITDASHELRTPLTTVAAVLELHENGSLPAGPELDEALRRASLETARMSGLVEDLLLLARLDQGRPLEEQPVDLCEIVADAAFDASIHQRGRTITTELDDHAFVVGDDQRLRQVVTNLTANALAHTPDDGEIVLRVRSDGDVCVLEVADNGPGMSAEAAAHVFERFFRADAGRSRAVGGTGLGLSIVASIVAAHHGAVSVETTPGHGATFRVVLPRDTADMGTISRKLPGSL